MSPSSVVLLPWAPSSVATARWQLSASCAVRRDSMAEPAPAAACPLTLVTGQAGAAGQATAPGEGVAVGETIAAAAAQ